MENFMRIRMTNDRACGADAETPGARGRTRSATWRCLGCSSERHFPGPVPASAAVPCQVCGRNSRSGPVAIGPGSAAMR